MAQKQNTGTEAPVVTMDAFSNPAARIGFGTLDLLQATEYPMTRMTQNYQLLTSLYRENWIIQNIIATIPNDMMRKWYELRTGADPEYLKQMAAWSGRTQIRKKLLLGMYWGRLYGGAAGVILIKGHNDMSRPRNWMQSCREASWDFISWTGGMAFIRKQIWYPIRRIRISVSRNFT